MYNLVFLLVCVIFAILFGKMLNVDKPFRPRILARTEGCVEGGNFTYFYLQYKMPVVLNLTSLSGDADLYISDTNMYPTYDPQMYALHSATCGEDFIELPENFESPVAIAVYGHAESSNFLLEIYENPKIPYSYKHWVSLVHETENLKNVNIDENKNLDKQTETRKEDNKKNNVIKKKKVKSSSNLPGVFSVLEILQLIFL